MSIKNAVEYCQTHSNVAISTPTPSVFNELRKYFHEHNIGWSDIINFTIYNNNTCIDSIEGVCVSYNCMSYYKNSNYEIIGIIKEPTKENTFKPTTVKIDDKEIALYSDNKTVMVAECDGQKICVNCNFDDTFDFKRMSNLALERLMDKIDKYEIQVGDIVELRQLENIPNELVGLQGTVISSKPHNNTIVVKFPIKFHGHFIIKKYSCNDIRVIYKIKRE